MMHALTNSDTHANTRKLFAHPPVNAFGCFPDVSIALPERQDAKLYFVSFLVT
jgi:hypothetical protein